jgi:hypothetical protein
VQDLMLLPLPWTFGRSPKGLTALDERKLPLVIDSWKGLYRERIELTLPAGWELGSEPEVVQLACEGATYRLEYRRGEDGRLSIERELEIRPVRVEPEQYPAFRDFLRQAVKAEKQPLVLRKAAS